MANFTLSCVLLPLPPALLEETQSRWSKAWRGSRAACGGFQRVPVNLGLPCKHMLKLFVVKQFQEIPTNLVHPLWIIDDDQVMQAEEALRRAELGGERGRRKTTLIDAGQVCKAYRESQLSKLLNKMKNLAVNSATSFDGVLAIFNKACDAAETDPPPATNLKEEAG